MLKFLLCMAGFLPILVGCGSDGKNGLDGTAGKDGTAGITVTSTAVCSKVQTVNALSLSFTYTVINYSTGGVLATCGVSGSSTESSSTSYYPNTASNSACITIFDVDGATAGAWNFTFVNGAAHALYSDSGSASNSTSVSLTCTVE